MAAAAGAAGRGVDNSRYYTNKHRSLIELGSGWTLSQGLRSVASPGPGGFSAPVLCSLRELKAGLASSIYARSESAGSPGRPPGREAAAHSAVWNLVSPPLWRRAAAFVGRPARADPLQKELDRDEVRFGATPVEQATGGTAS